MANKTFDTYGAWAKTLTDHTLIAGRYACQKDAEQRVVTEVAEKLDLAPSHSLLDIGCGTGNLLIPLVEKVRRAVGVDHAECIAKLRSRAANGTLETCAGDFMAMDFDAGFDRILCYSVLHCLSSMDDVYAMVSRALSFLNPRGVALFGDLPNLSRRKRFAESEHGIAFSAQWDEIRAATESEEEKQRTQIGAFDGIGAFDDQQILDLVSHFRKRGFSAFVVPQCFDLPFGYTREDLLVLRE